MSQQAPTNNAVTSTSGTTSWASASRARVSAFAREDHAKRAREKGDDNQLWRNTWSMCYSVNERWVLSGNPIEAYEWDLHDLWHSYYQSAMHISHLSPQQDRLALQLFKAKAEGVLTRRRPRQSGNDNSARVTDDNGNEEEEDEEAVTSDGKIWVDLPFLTSDMTNYWIANCSTMSGTQRHNFASFLANVASAGTVPDNRLHGIALITLRDALETARLPGGSLDEPGEEGAEDPARRMEDLTLASLLPSASVWLIESGRQLIHLSEANWNGFPAPFGEPGPLLQERVGGPTAAALSAGFSPGRWMFWFERLGEIHNLVSQTNQSLAKLCQGTMESMLVIAVEAAGTAIRPLLVEGGHLAVAGIRHVAQFTLRAP